MKKYFRLSILGKAVLLLVLLGTVIALINLASFDGNTFYIRTPSPIVTVYLDKAASPAIHVNLSGLALDLLLAYAVCWVIDRKKQPK